MTNDNNLLSIKSATAVPNTSDISTEFTFDSYIQQTGSGKNWASKNLPVLTYDMGKLVDITKIDVAFNYSRDRETYYDLLISEDGSTWITIDERNPETGGSAITTTGNMSDFVTIYEGTVRARYVQFKLRSHTESGYDDASAFNSIQEISFYGVEVEPSDLSEPSVSDELSEIN